jgi:hypothetical protein
MVGGEAMKISITKKRVDPISTDTKPVIYEIKLEATGTFSETEWLWRALDKIIEIARKGR